MKIPFLRAVLALCLGATTGSLVAADYIATPSNPNASQVTRNVYDYLRTRRGQATNSMIEGQFLGMINQILYPQDYGDFSYESHKIVDKWPAMIGSRYDGADNKTGVYRLDAEICSLINAPLIAAWDDKYPIIHMTATPRNPWNPALGRVKDDPANQKIGKLCKAAVLTDAEKVIRDQFWADIDVIAGGLQELKAAGIPVLFRPFAEFNTKDKYYFDQQSGADFVALWKEVYNYCVTPAPAGKGLDNLLFCWEAWALNRDSVTNASIFDAWYPGDSYVDSVAGAFYFLPSITYIENGVFTFAHADLDDLPVLNWLISQHRPFGSAQWGLNQGAYTPGDNDFTRAFMTFCPDLAYAFYWFKYQSVDLQTHAYEFAYDDARVATHDDLPVFDQVTSTFTSIAAEDGRVLESGENTNVGGSFDNTAASASALRVGDDAGVNGNEKQLKLIVSFDTSALAGTQILSATLKLKRGTASGTNPFTTHGACNVDICTGGFGGNTALAASDFEATATATQVATLSNPVNNGDISSGTLNAAGIAAINKGGRTQLRVSFATDDNDNSISDYIGFYSADDTVAANRPVLEITYR